MNNTLDLELIQAGANLELIARNVVEGFITGLHKSPFHGFSVEFAEHRQYNSGESTKDIDWKLFARTDKLFTKKYEEETNLRCQILIDSSSSMNFPDEKVNKFLFSVYSAACLINLLRKQRDAVGLTLFSGDVEAFYPARSNYGHIQLLYNHLQRALAFPGQQKKTSTAATLHMIAENIHKRSMVVIFSDMFDNLNSMDEMLSGLQHMRYKKHEILLFHVLDKKYELDFSFENRPYQFIDMETGEKLNLFPSQVKGRYHEQMEEFRKELKQKCNQYRIEYIEADIRQGFYQVLQNYLVKRSRLY